MFGAKAYDYLIPIAIYLWYYVFSHFVFKKVFDAKAGYSLHLIILAGIVTFLPAIIVIVRVLWFVLADMWMFWIIPALGFAYVIINKIMKK